MHTKLILALLGIHVHCLGDFLVFGVVPPGRNMNLNSGGFNRNRPGNEEPPLLRGGPTTHHNNQQQFMEQRRGIPPQQQQQPMMMKTNGPPHPQPQNWRPRQEFPQQQQKPCLNCYNQQQPQSSPRQRDVQKPLPPPPPSPYQRQPPSQRRSSRQVQGFFQIFPSFKEAFKRTRRSPVSHSHHHHHHERGSSMFGHHHHHHEGIRDGGSSYAHQIIKRQDLPLLIRIEFEVSEEDNDETQLEVVEEQEQ